MFMTALCEQVTEEMAAPPPGLQFELPWAATVPGLEDMDKKMVM